MPACLLATHLVEAAVPTPLSPAAKLRLQARGARVPTTATPERPTTWRCGASPHVGARNGGGGWPLRDVHSMEAVWVHGLSLLRQKQRRRWRRDGQLGLFNDARCSFDLAWGGTVARPALGHGTTLLSPHRGRVWADGWARRHYQARHGRPPCHIMSCRALVCPCRAGRSVWKSILMTLPYELSPWPMSRS
jgi:hypothetical protein